MAEARQSTLLEATGRTIDAWVDGSCLNNGEPDAVGGYGCVIRSSERRESNEITDRVGYDGRVTNNVAEYKAVIAALERILAEHSTDVAVRIYSDSKLVVRQLTGDWIVQKDHLTALHQEAHQHFEKFDEWRIEQRSESDAPEIQRADELAKAAARGESA